MDNLRLFVAVELPDEVKAALSGIVAALRRRAAELGLDRELVQVARWVRPDGVHLTLKFLGGTRPDLVEPIVAGMQRAASGCQPFSLHLTELGAFPSPRRARVLWVGFGGELEVLVRLQQQVEQEISPLGFRTEERAFHAHATLARLEMDRAAVVAQLLEAGVSVPSVGWRVDGVSLMRSELRREGARYSQLAFVALEPVDG